MNHVVLIGRLTKNPEMRYIPGSGTAVATFTVAVDRNFTKKDGTKDTDFIPVELMGKTAEFCGKYVTKGRLVSIEGPLRVDHYKDQNGQNKTFTKVSGKSIQVLDSKKDNNTNTNSNSPDEPVFEPNFEPQGLDPNGFQAIDDDEIPF